MLTREALPDLEDKQNRGQERQVSLTQGLRVLQLCMHLEPGSLSLSEVSTTYILGSRSIRYNRAPIWL